MRDANLHQNEPDVTRIDVGDFEEARRDPRVRETLAAAEAYADALVVAGHCRCHLVVNCPDDRSHG